MKDIESSNYIDFVNKHANAGLIPDNACGKRNKELNPCTTLNIVTTIGVSQRNLFKM